MPEGLLSAGPVVLVEQVVDGGSGGGVWPPPNGGLSETLGEGADLVMVPSAAAGCWPAIGWRERGVAVEETALLS